ncbi:hypothetical protein A3Q56_08280, partial [Intoshia linei]
MPTISIKGGKTIQLTVRTLFSSEIHKIEKYHNLWKPKLYNRINLVEIVEKSIISIALIDENDNDKIYAVAIFNYKPNRFPYSNKLLEQVGNDAEPKFTQLNSIWLNYYVSDPVCTKSPIAELLKALFTINYDVEYCVMDVLQERILTKSEIEQDDELNVIYKNFQPIHEMDTIEKESNTNQLTKHHFVFLVAVRNDFIPRLRIRSARVEDNDDLVPIFNKQTNILRKTYGEYFLAELIEAQDNTMKCIVAEVNGRAIAFMSISTEVSYDTVRDCCLFNTFYKNKEDVKQRKNNDANFDNFTDNVKNCVRKLDDANITEKDNTIHNNENNSIENHDNSNNDDIDIINNFDDVISNKENNETNIEIEKD